MLFAAAVSEASKAFWTITVAGLCGVSCALLGSFLLLRRMSLLGDAISHGILPGIALAVLVSGTLYGPVLLLGAMLFGFLTAFLAQSLSSLGKVTEDASLGVVFTSLFAVGVILINTRYLRRVDLDPQCIFFGLLEGVALRTEYYLGIEMPDAAPTQIVTFLLVLGFIVVFWKELKIATFDPGLATAMGYRPLLIHYLLIGLVACSTVSSFEAVGSILVVAMLVVPAATAHLLTDRLAPMLLWAAFLALTSAALAYVLASPALFASNIPGMMALVSGAQLGVVVLFAPRHGLAARGLRRLRLALRIAEEETLAFLYRRVEGAPTTLAVDLKEHGIGAWIERWAQWRLRRHGFVATDAATGLTLTSAGQARAQEIVRAHRLWESFLEKELSLPPDHLHAPASRIEHFLGPRVQGEIVQELDQPERDPHGREIPGKEIDN